MEVGGWEGGEKKGEGNYEQNILYGKMFAIFTKRSR